MALHILLAAFVTSCDRVKSSLPAFAPANPSPFDSSNPYQTTDMAGRRNERIEFPYAGQPGMAPHQQQHPAPVQPSMNVPQPQQPPSGPGSQQQTPTPTPQPSRQRNKRPAPGTVPSPATPAAVPAVAAGQPPVPTPPNAQSAAPPAAPAPADDRGTAPPQPPAKKSRTNTPWTRGEELRLKQMRDAGNSWAEIAKVRSGQRIGIFMR